MSNDRNLSRFFGGGCGKGILGNGGLIVILIIGAFLLLGEELIESLFCDDMLLIWVILLVLLLTSFDFDNGCGCC